MGLFDYLRCKLPLPVAGANDLEFQTKDTDAQYMDHYEIREDGTLWHQEYDTEDRSDPNAEGLAALFGCMTRVNERWVQDDMTGEVRFYTYFGDANDKQPISERWIEFSAYFASGQLKQLETISDGTKKDQP